MTIEQRDFKLEGQDFTFQVNTLRTAEEWKPAKEFKMTYDMPAIGTGKRMVIETGGISYDDFESIIAIKYPDKPDFDTDMSPNTRRVAEAAYQAEHDNIESIKVAKLFELATGKVIPGETDEDKAEFIAKRGKGEVAALVSYITDNCTGLALGQLADVYKIATAEEKNESKIFTGFDDWQEAAEVDNYFRIHRPFEEVITEFPLRSVSQRAMAEIEAKTKAPEPPKRPGRNPTTKKLDPRYQELDLNNYQYVKQMKARKDLRIVLLFESCLPFVIPGDNTEAKRTWIGERLAGDVINLERFIENEMVGAGSRLDFFTRG